MRFNNQCCSLLCQCRWIDSWSCRLFEGQDEVASPVDQVDFLQEQLGEALGSQRRIFATSQPVPQENEKDLDRKVRTIVWSVPLGDAHTDPSATEFCIMFTVGDL